MTSYFLFARKILKSSSQNIRSGPMRETFCTISFSDLCRTSLRLVSASRSRSCSFDLTRTCVLMYMSSIGIGSTRQPFSTHRCTALISSSVPCCKSDFLRMALRSPDSSACLRFPCHLACTPFQLSTCPPPPSFLRDLLRIMPLTRKSLSATARALAGSYPRSFSSQVATGVISDSGISRNALNRSDPSSAFCSGKPSWHVLLTALMACQQSRYGARLIIGKMETSMCFVTSVAPSQHRSLHQ
mmetsp:Transcript_47058/g.152741  ORF Transcript_47058/g.152741 Transcript_47058/m.152741 type:complete len:243 (+) Transcript_47058:1935-2663(+)